MCHRISTLSGFVLAGGASHRMGRPKAGLVLGRETLLERQIRLLEVVSRSVAVVGSPAGFAGLAVPVFPDDLPGCGPLGGIYTALRKSRTEFALIVGCDLPFMQVRFLGYLAARALASQADVTVPQSPGGHYEPVCAVYRRRALPAIRASLEAGKCKTSDFFHRVRSQTIPWREIARAGFPPRIFANMNTLAGYEAAKTILNGEL